MCLALLGLGNSPCKEPFSHRHTPSLGNSTCKKPFSHRHTPSLGNSTYKKPFSQRHTPSLGNSTCKKLFSHRHTPRTFFRARVASSNVPINIYSLSMVLHEATDCWHTTHSNPVPVLLSSTSQRSQQHPWQSNTGEHNRNSTWTNGSTISKYIRLSSRPTKPNVI